MLSSSQQSKVGALPAVPPSASSTSALLLPNSYKRHFTFHTPQLSIHQLHIFFGMLLLST